MYIRKELTLGINQNRLSVPFCEASTAGGAVSSACPDLELLLSRVASLLVVPRSTWSSDEVLNSPLSLPTVVTPPLRPVDLVFGCCRGGRNCGATVVDGTSFVAADSFAVVTAEFLALAKAGETEVVVFVEDPPTSPAACLTLTLDLLFPPFEEEASP